MTSCNGPLLPLTFTLMITPTSEAVEPNLRGHCSARCISHAAVETKPRCTCYEQADNDGAHCTCDATHASAMKFKGARSRSSRSLSQPSVVLLCIDVWLENLLTFRRIGDV